MTFHPLISKHIPNLTTLFLNDDHDDYYLNIENFLKDRSKFIIDNNLQELPLEYHRGVYVCPIFSEQLCDALLKLADVKRDAFKPNEEEPEQAQIPEIVFGVKYPKLFDQFAEAAARSIIPLFILVNGTAPSTINSIQMARYTPENTAHGCWHTDEDSMYTCVISLGPERHEGGGTSFLPTGPLGEVVEIPALPKGWGAFFNGKITQHKGSLVTSGVRDLLVFWMD